MNIEYRIIINRYKSISHVSIMNRVEQLKKIQEEALELFTKKYKSRERESDFWVDPFLKRRFLESALRGRLFIQEHHGHSRVIMQVNHCIS